MFANAFGNHQKVECGLVCFPERRPDDYSPIKPVPIPLESVSILASVVHAVAQVELTQVFVNKEEQPIEAIYFFPVDSNGGVTHFHAELEGRTIKGVVKPQEEAKAQYEKAVSENQTAFLVDSNKPDIFKVRIGFLKPGAQVKVVIGYVTDVKNEKGTNAQRFFIPTTVAPRYVPPGDTGEKSIELKTMQFSETSPAPLTITVNVSLQGGIKSLDSPTHQVTVTEKALIPEKPNWTRAVVKLSGKTTDMDRDFVLLITPEEVHAPRLYVEEFEQSHALMAHLIPSFSLEDQKVELIFILDRSGSMMGQSIDLAKKALTLFLHSAPVECYFNIIGFGSSFEFLFPESVKYDDGSLKKAVAHAQSLQANLGGTELLQPLKEVFNKPLVPGHLRQIFVLTDGEISNTEAVLGLTKANAHLGRLFSLGIGDGCSHHLVEGLAESGGGTSSFVTYNESIDSKVLQQLKNAIQPSLSEVRIDWIGVSEAEPVPPKVLKINTEMTLLGHGKPIQTLDDSEKKAFTQVPEKVPPIYDGTQLLVFGLFESSLPTGVRITAESPDGPLSIEVKFDPLNNLGSTGMLHKLASIKLVRELEMKINGFSSGYGGSPVDPITEGLRKEIVAVSCKHGVSSKYTSFVAVDLDDKTANENWVMQTRHVPSQYAHGWHGGSGLRAMAMPYSSQGSLITKKSVGRSRFGPTTKCSSFQSYNPPLTQGVSRPMCKRISKRSIVTPETVCDSYSIPDEGESMLSEPDVSSNVLATSQDHLHALVATQSFNGSFPLNIEFTKSIGQTLDVLQKEAKEHGADETGFATALALAYFKHQLFELKNSWELVEGKARKWLVKNFPENYLALITAAEKVVQSIA